MTWSSVDGNVLRPFAIMSGIRDAGSAKGVAYNAMRAYNIIYQIIYLRRYMTKEKISNSYMQLALRLDGKDDLFLRVPTLWDSIKNQWIGFIKTPKTKKIIHGQGKDSFELQNDFNINLEKIFHDPEYAYEIFSMFKPMEYWEEE